MGELYRNADEKSIMRGSDTVLRGRRVPFPRLPFPIEKGYTGCMIIGIDASFLRKPGTGIGQVTEQTLRVLSHLPESSLHRFILYLEEYADLSAFPGNFEKRVFLPRWTRDDVPRRILWERSLPNRAAADRCDLFISLSQSAAVFGAASGIRHLMVVHDIVPMLFPEYLGKFTNRIHTGLIASAIPSADRILAVSEATKRDLGTVLGIPEDRIVVAYPDCAPRFRKPVSDTESDRVLRKYGLTAGYIYHGGGLEIRKNTGRLLEAYAKLLRERGDLPPLVVTGRVYDRRNPLATDVEGIVARLGIGDRVKLLGFVPEEDLPALYRKASVFAFPSLYEGFGIPLLEAFSVGTPVLAGEASGSVPEIVGSAASLVSVRDTDALATGLERLLDDASFRDTLVERGRERIPNFSWHAFSEALFSESVGLVGPIRIDGE